MLFADPSTPTTTGPGADAGCEFIVLSWAPAARAKRALGPQFLEDTTVQAEFSPRELD